MSNADLYLEYDGIQQLTRKEWSSRASRLVNVIKTKVNEETYYPTVVTLISDYVQQGQTRQRNFNKDTKEYLDIGIVLSRLMKVAQDYGEGAKFAKNTAGRTQRPPYLSNPIADEDEEANRRALARTAGAKNKEKAENPEDLQPIFKENRKEFQDFIKLSPIVAMQRDPNKLGEGEIYLSPDNVIMNAQNIKNAFQELLEKDKFSHGKKEGTNTSQNLTNPQRQQINKKDDGFIVRLDRIINMANIKKDLTGFDKREEEGKKQAEKSKVEKKGVPKDLLDELRSDVLSMEEDIKDLEGPEYASLPGPGRTQLITSYKEQLEESKKILEELNNLENTKETDLKPDPIPPEVPEAKVGDEGQGIFKSELQDYLNRYKQIPTINLTTEITELIKQAERALEPEPGGKPSKVTLQELLPHRNYFERIGRTGQTGKGLFTTKKPIDQIIARQDRSTANKLIDDSVREAKKMNEQIKKEEEDVKMKDLRPDVEEGKEIYEGIDKEEKELTDQNQFLKHKLNIKDKEIELLKATIDQERNKNNLEFLNNTAPVFRKFLNIQLKDVFQENNKDFVKSVF